MCWPTLTKEQFLPWLPLLMTVAGWFMVNWQNNRRENRKEERALLDAAKKLVIDMATKARAYMSAIDRNEETEADIKAGVDQLEIELGRLPRYKQETKLINAVAAFGDAATAADFESATRMPRKLSDAEPQALMAARNTLLTSLELLFSARYPR